MKERLTSDGSVAAGGVSCGHCQTQNGPAREFCSQCGKPLWEQCIKCKATCASSETYCGQCGTNWREAIAAEVDRVETALREAATLEQEADFPGAIRILHRLPDLRHPTLKGHSVRVKERIEDLALKDSTQQQTLDLGVERVEQLLQRHAYQDAVRLLQEIPKAVRTESVDQLLSTARSRVEELERLKADIAKATKEKDYKSLSALVERLLGLKPDSRTAQKLAAQLADRFLRAAHAKLQAYQYDRTLKVLELVPSISQNKTYEKLQLRATELKWMHQDICESPLIDATLLDIGQRLLKQTPDDKETKRILANIQRRSRDGSDDPRCPAPAWIRPPERTALGKPISWLGKSAQLAVTNEKVAAELKSDPGRFFPAIGLALQGIDKATVTTNLSPAKASLLGNLNLGKRKETRKTAWGIDIGDSALKAVRLAWEADGDKVTVEDCALVPHRSHLSQPSEMTERSKLVRETLATFAESREIGKGERIAVSIPGYRVLGRFLTLPDAPEKKLREIVGFEVQQQIPVPLEELQWSYQVMNPDDVSEDDDVPIARRVLLQAVKKFYLNEELGAIKETLGQDPAVVQSDCIALHNFAMFDELLEPAEEEQQHRLGKSVAVIDVGAAATNIVISAHDRVWFRSVQVAGDSFTDRIVRELKLTREQSESIKRRPAQARRLSTLYSCIEPVFAQLTEEVRRSFDSFSRENEDMEIERAYGTGGAFRLHGLMRHFRAGP